MLSCRPALSQNLNWLSTFVKNLETRVSKACPHIYVPKAGRAGRSAPCTHVVVALHKGRLIWVCALTGEKLWFIEQIIFRLIANKNCRNITRCCSKLDLSRIACIIASVPGSTGLQTWLSHLWYSRNFETQRRSCRTNHYLICFHTQNRPSAL